MSAMRKKRTQSSTGHWLFRHLSQPHDCRCHAVGPLRAAVDAKTVFVSAAGGEERTWGDRDFFFQCPKLDCHGIAPARKFHPQNKPTGGSADARALREGLGDRRRISLNLLGVDPPDGAQVPLVTAIRQKLGDHLLREGWRADGVGELIVLDDLIPLLRHRAPADACARGQASC